MAVANTNVERGSPWGTPSEVSNMSSTKACGIATLRLHRFFVEPWFLRAYVFFQLVNAGLAMHCTKGVLKIRLSRDMCWVSVKVGSHFGEKGYNPPCGIPTPN